MAKMAETRDYLERGFIIMTGAPHLHKIEYLRSPTKDVCSTFFFNDSNSSHNKSRKRLEQSNH